MLYDQFILFGDSLFQHSSSQERGFALAPALQAEYIRRLDVVNRGFSGYNTNQAVSIVDKVIPDPSKVRTRFLVIFFGANDSCLQGAPGSQHVPLHVYAQNLEKIIAHARAKQVARIILVTPPPINEYATEENDRSKGYTEPRRKASHTVLYADAARKVAQVHDVTILDLNALFLQHAGQADGGLVPEGSKEKPLNSQLRRLLYDGLHFTSTAYMVFFEELMKTIQKMWPDQTPEALPFILPAWNDEKSWPAEVYDAGAATP
ncbi:MAG: hypothetical protein Q9159_002516 [Coniocarpon cinnabarinum]